MDFRNLKEPYVILLIGPPLSGKSTFVKKNFPNTSVISRDELVMEVWGSRNYTEAFKNVNQKEVDRLLIERLEEANDEGANVIIDMTNMTSKRRRYNLSFFSDDYYKLGIIFPILSDSEYVLRNNKRKLEENKDLPIHIVKNMIANYQIIKDNEGFNKVISL